MSPTASRHSRPPLSQIAFTSNSSIGSPPPRFSTDEGRTYFLVELPVHPQLRNIAGRAADEAAPKGHDEGHDETQGARLDKELRETGRRLLAALLAEPRTRTELAETLGTRSLRTGHLSRVMERLRRLGMAEWTIPDKPRSRNQKMRITAKGWAWLASQGPWKPEHPK